MAYHGVGRGSRGRSFSLSVFSVFSVFSIFSAVPVVPVVPVVSVVFVFSLFSLCCLYLYTQCEECTEQIVCGCSGCFIHSQSFLSVFPPLILSPHSFLISIAWSDAWILFGRGRLGITSSAGTAGWPSNCSPPSASPTTQHTPCRPSRTPSSIKSEPVPGQRTATR